MIKKCDKIQRRKSNCYFSYLVWNKGPCSTVYLQTKISKSPIMCNEYGQYDQYLIKSNTPICHIFGIFDILEEFEMLKCRICRILGYSKLHQYVEYVKYLSYWSIGNIESCKIFGILAVFGKDDRTLKAELFSWKDFHIRLFQFWRKVAFSVS